MRLCSLAFVVFAAACVPVAPVGEGEDAVTAAHAQLVFHTGWTDELRGTLARGGHADVTYDRARMGRCADATIFAYARFLPGGELFSSDEAFGFDVPAAANRVELWFHAVSPSCNQWDSDYGRNWRFAF